MKFLKIRDGLILGMLLCVLGGAGHAFGHEGQQHIETPASGSPPSASVLHPHRFEAVSPDFELVGILEGRKLSLWLDRAPTNEPVVMGTLELEMGDLKLRPQLEGDIWVVQLPAQWRPGPMAVVAKVTSDGLTDLLAGELAWSEADALALIEPWWKRFNLSWIVGVGLGLVMGAAGWFWRQRRTALNREDQS